jgi:energy-coupling factor transporter ATP-binding protein EcfA2
MMHTLSSNVPCKTDSLLRYLKIKSGEKVGICGSGKSSLMIVLFRIAELEKNGGAIYTDGVNTGEIGTSALRLNLSIIPQEPIIFSNTVRYNLDPASGRGMPLFVMSQIYPSLPFKGFSKKMASTTSKPQTERLPFASWSVAVQKWKWKWNFGEEIRQVTLLGKAMGAAEALRKICRGP